MARIQPINFKMNYRIEFCTNIRGHHVYKASWTPEFGEKLICFKDNRSEALEYDKHAIGVYKKVDKPDEKQKLVGHVPIECSSLLDYFLQADSSNRIVAIVEGKRKREIGLVVPGKFICFTKQLRQANILFNELVEKKTKYSHFEMDRITFDKKKWPSVGPE